MATLESQYQSIAQGRHGDPFAILGPHGTRKDWTLRSWQPQAQAVEVLGADDEILASMERVHADGLFAAQLPLPVVSYRLRLHENGHSHVIDDPYRFASPLGDLDRHLMREGKLQDLAHKLGAHPMQVDGVSGVHFAVWAPNASRVSVVGLFNGWDGRRHVMRRHPTGGVWDIFIPSLCPGDYYKFELLDAAGKLLPLKADPFARHMEQAPGNASIVYTDDYQWQDNDWLIARQTSSTLDQPMSVYEVHLGSWRRHVQDNQPLSYRELADSLVDYVRDMGYTHIELLPVSEYPFDGSWGYQPVGLFAPTSRFGNPADFKFFIDCCHRQGIGVIMDWVPAHFPRDEFGLGQFDGSHLYEHADPRQGSHPDWGTLIFNFGRPEVSNYLIANAVFWVEEYHIDALRVDAVASMLYLDYSRDDGAWVANQYGGNENLEAVEFLRRMNERVHLCGAITIAEESTAWPGVSHPVYKGGLGFSYKWNMGWMHDSLAYFGEDPVHRRFHQDKLTFGLLYAFSENFILPLSHDEVVHGKGSMIRRMPGDRWQAFANLRLYYAFMYTHPGKKLLFMGGEFAQVREWNHNQSLDWHLLEQADHAGVQQLLRDLNRLYRDTAALHQLDSRIEGFGWIDCSDTEQSVIAFARHGSEASQLVIAVCNMTPVVRKDYRIGVPRAGRYLERINSDAEVYGGSGVGNFGAVESQSIPQHGHQQSINLVLPPLTTLIFTLETH
ncbi:MAG TPA: 1,4-alpha-glucan branching protein GlgB [Gammaproteobacteria bacterium]|nr:1,4-alpha-glucan branching protein GlgB [Gammaproteobacteria bacterium]